MRVSKPLATPTSSLAGRNGAFGRLQALWSSTTVSYLRRGYGVWGAGLANGKQMLSQRLLTRRVPQLAARSIVPRASFSHARMLRADAEVGDPLQVRYASLRGGCVFSAGQLTNDGVSAITEWQL